jgi:hypothetical protein
MARRRILFNGHLSVTKTVPLSYFTCKATDCILRSRGLQLHHRNCWRMRSVPQSSPPAPANLRTRLRGPPLKRQIREKMKRGGGCTSATNPKGGGRPAIGGSIGGSNSSSIAPASTAAPSSFTSASSFSKENSSDGSNNDTVRYQVLYYKSSRKVHKSRGVSKSDGTLTVSRSTGAVRLASCLEHGGAKDAPVLLFSGSNPAIHKRCDDLEGDETMRLGSYEIDIVARQHASAGMGSGAVVPRKPVPAAPQGRLVSRRPGLLPAKRPLGSTGARWNSHPPAQPAPVPSAPQLNAMSHPSIVSGNRAGNDETPSAATGPTDVALRKNTIFRRPLQSVSSMSAKGSGPPRAALPSSQPLHRPTGSIGTSHAVKRPAAATAAIRTSHDHDDNDTGASLDDVTKRMPVKVAAVLRPHQVAAVQFLWSALKEGGAILADGTSARECWNLVCRSRAWPALRRLDAMLPAGSTIASLFSLSIQI